MRPKETAFGEIMGGGSLRFFGMAVLSRNAKNGNPLHFD